MDYQCTMYDSYEDARDSGHYDGLIDDLLNAVGEGPWQHAELRIYPSVADFGISQYLDLHASSVEAEFSIDQQVYADPVDFIDWEGYGKACLALSKTYAHQCGDCVIATDRPFWKE